MKLKVLVVDDHGLTRAGVIAVISKSKPDWVFFEASDGIEAIEQASREKPDIILMDYRMPNMDGFEATAAIRSELPGVKILLVTMEISDEVISKAVDLGIVGIVPKEYPETEIITAIEAAMQGKNYYKGDVGDGVLNLLQKERKMQVPDPEDALSVFTDRELEIMKLLAAGKGPAYIAGFLIISPQTAEKHKANIFKKGDFHNIAELIHYALKHRLVKI